MSEIEGPIGDGDTEAGFIDVAANALAIMILATMMLIVVAAPIRLVGDVVPSEVTPEVSFPVRADSFMRPLYSYHFVSEAGITPIDLDAIAWAVAATSGDASTVQGKMRVTTPRRARRDWNEYRGGFAPDHAAIKSAAVIMTPVARDPFVSELSARYEAENVAPTFFVLPGGVEVIAPIYWSLRAEGVPVRWFAAKYGADIQFERSPRIFELPGALD